VTQFFHSPSASKVNNKKRIQLNMYTIIKEHVGWSRDSPVDIATDYGLDGKMFDSRQEQEPYLYSTASHQVSYLMGTGWFFPEGKATSA
jgi:hypothetical protein